MTAWMQTRTRACLCVVIAAALGFALNAGRRVDERRPDSLGILAFAGDRITPLVNRPGNRAEYARQRPPIPSACILISDDHDPQDDRRGDALVEGQWLRSLDPVCIKSGRAPPLALSFVQLTFF